MNGINMDLTCPVCLGVYFKPISLPCGHTLCKGCLEKSLDITTLTCPVCRFRLSVWKRRLKDTDTCIDSVREHKIEQLFPKYYSARSKGLDATLDESELNLLNSVVDSNEIHRSAALPGTIMSEFNACIARIQHEQQSKADLQEEASLAMARELSLESNSLDSEPDIEHENIVPQKHCTTFPSHTSSIKRRASSTNLSPKRLRNYANISQRRPLSTYFPSPSNSTAFKTELTTRTSSPIASSSYCTVKDFSIIPPNSKLHRDTKNVSSSSKSITGFMNVLKIDEDDQIKSDEAFARSLAREFEATAQKPALPKPHTRFRPHVLRSRINLRSKSIFKQSTLPMPSRSKF